MRHVAIRNIYPSVASVAEGDIWVCYDTNENEVVIDQTLVDAEVFQLTAEYIANEYARNRLTAYNALNQFELISDDSINGTTTHKDAVLAIKAEFPKPV